MLLQAFYSIRSERQLMERLEYDLLFRWFASGRGWVVLGTAGRLVGYFYIHNADDSGFVCDRA
jgi:hypothetical protein